jgi:hypothetical protein
MIINLTRYKMTKAAAASVVTSSLSHGEEVMNANWNPAVSMLNDSGSEKSLSPELPADLTHAEAQSMLDRIYALATQI